MPIKTISDSRTRTAPEDIWVSPIQICDGTDDCLGGVDGISADENGCSDGWVGWCIGTNYINLSRCLSVYYIQLDSQYQRSQDQRKTVGVTWEFYYHNQEKTI